MHDDGHFDEPIAPGLIDGIVTGALADWRGVAHRLNQGAYPVV